MPDELVPLLIELVVIDTQILTDNDALVQAAILGLTRSRTDVERLLLRIVCAFDFGRTEYLVGNHEEILEIDDKTIFIRNVIFLGLRYLGMLRLQFLPCFLNDGVEFAATVLIVGLGRFSLCVELIAHGFKNIFFGLFRGSPSIRI